MRKFSGIMETGRNTDLTGCACDALAHFSSYDSGGTAVLVDIQGVSIILLTDLKYIQIIQGLR